MRKQILSFYTLLAMAVFIAVIFLIKPAYGDPFAYVTNRNSNSVSIIDIATNTVVDTVSVGSAPQFITVSPYGDFIYVGNAGSQNISVINAVTNSVETTIPVGLVPHAIAFTPDGNFVYSTNQNSNNVSVINAATKTVITTIPVVYRPTGIAISPDGQFAYVANELNSSTTQSGISVIDIATNTNIDPDSKTPTVLIPNNPGWLEITPDGKYLYVPQLTSNTVAIIDTTTNMHISSVTVGNGPFAVVFSPDGELGYVTNRLSNTVSVINTSIPAVVGTIPVGNHPIKPALTPDGAFLYVPNSDDNTVSVVDTATRTVVTTLPVEVTPWGVTITPIVHACVGFDEPMNVGAVTIKKNRALPLKAQLLDRNYDQITDTDIAEPPVIQVIYQGIGQAAVDVSDEAIPAGLGTNGNQFEYDIQTERWRFNLLTKNYTAPGTYSITMVPGDSYLINPACEATFVIK